MADAAALALDYPAICSTSSTLSYCCAVRNPEPQLRCGLQMTVGRRSETLKSASRDGAAPPEGGSGRTLAAWRQARGFRPPPLATHSCAGRPTFSALPGRSAHTCTFGDLWPPALAATHGCAGRSTFSALPGRPELTAHWNICLCYIRYFDLRIAAAQLHSPMQPACSCPLIHLQGRHPSPCHAIRACPRTIEITLQAP